MVIEEALSSHDDPERFLHMLGEHAFMHFGMREAFEMVAVFAKDPVLTIRTFEVLTTVQGQLPIDQYLKFVARALQRMGRA